MCVDSRPIHDAGVDLISMVETLEFDMNRLLISKCHFSKDFQFTETRVTMGSRKSPLWPKL